MGFAVTVAATPKADLDALLSGAGLVVTDRPDPDGAAQLSGAEFGDHWLMWRNLRGAPLMTEPDWNSLSRSAGLLVLDVVDTAGAQVLRGFENGAHTFEVSFADNNDDLLLIEGALPVDVSAIRADLRRRHLEAYPEDADQAEEELVAGYGADIPSRVFEAITGFYHEDGPPRHLRELSGDLPQIRVGRAGEATGPRRKPWWKFW